MLDLERLEQDGFAIVEPFLSEGQVHRLIAVIESSASPSAGRGGTRDVADLQPEIAALADNPVIRSLVELVLGKKPFVVRATLFDKTGASNWKVPWHQDVTVAVATRQELPGYGPWSVKAGLVHVQPPASVLERMLTVRIHLDPCPRSNGALRVMPLSHLLGKLNQNCVGPHVDESRAVWCEVEAGAALVMRPLLLHASSPSTFPQHRRVVHFDFAVDALDGNLKWRMARTPDQ